MKSHHLNNFGLWKPCHLRRVRLFAFLCSTLLVFLSPRVWAGEAFIIDVIREKQENRIVISARIKGAFTQEIEEAIKSGAPVSFTYRLQVKQPRAVIWDKTVRDLAVKRMVKFDTLRKKYFTWEKKAADEDNINFEAELSAIGYKNSNGNGQSNQTPEEQKEEQNSQTLEPETVPTFDKLEEWMTILDKIDLGQVEGLAPFTPYYARVKCEMKSIKLVPPFNYILFFVSLWDFNTDWSNSTSFTIHGVPVPAMEGKEPAEVE